MEEPRSAELVPDTPKHDQHEESASQSLLFAYRQPPPASFSGPSLDHSGTEFASQVPSTHPHKRRSRSPRARSPIEGDELRMDEDGAGEVSTVCDSQMPRREPSPSRVARPPAPRLRRVSGETTFSHSQPTDGPGTMEGDIGETQAESLAAGSGMSEREKKTLGIKGGRRETGDFADSTRTNEEVSMDLTRADGRVLEQSIMEEPSAVIEEEEETEDRQPTPSAEPRPSESQKENPPSARPASVPGSSGLPFSLRNSQTVVEEPGAPSSSGLVADVLLQRSSPKKPNSTPLDEPTPMSSADPPISSNQLFSPGRRSKAIHGSPELVKQSISGPETSTPSYANAPPPHPLTAQRTNPNITYHSQASSITASPQAPATRSAPNLGLRATSSRSAEPFATSAAMKAPPPRKKQKRDVFDSMSTQSEQSLQEPTQEASPELPQTVVHVEPEEEEKDEEKHDGSQATPKPTMERTMDMDLDDSDPLDQPYTGIHSGELFNDESQLNSLDTIDAARPPPAQPAVQEEDSLASRSGRRSVPQPETSPSSERSVSRQNSQVSAKDGGRGKRLSDIVGSSPNPTQTQFEVPGTQNEYDLFSHSASTSNSHSLPHGSVRPLNTQDISFNNGEAWHGSFAVDTDTSHNQSRDTTSVSLVSHSRALKRNAPPPTPVRDGIVAANIPKPSSPTRSHNPDSLPLDPTQLDDPTQVDESNDSMRLPIPPAEFRHPPPQPTQSVPESSPEVPLARKRPRERSSGSPTAQQEQLLSARTSSRELAQQRQQHAISSNGLVPDSEGPTQAASSDDLPPPPPIASSSKARTPAVVRERDEQQIPAHEFYHKDDFGGGFDEQDQDMRDAEEAEEEEVDQLEEDDEQLENPSPPPQVTNRSPKGKGKVKLPSPAKLAKKVVPTVKKGFASSATATGKGRALHAEDSPDALDLLSTTTTASSRRRPAGNSAGTTVEETNYSELPSAKNAKKRSPKKAGPASRDKGKGKRKASAELSEDEDEEGSETEREEEEEEQPTRKRGRWGAVVEEEGEEEREEPPKKGRRASAGKSATTTKATSAAKGKKVVKVPPPKEKKAGRGRHSKTASVGSAASASRSPEPQQPVAGPSRLRFQSVEDEIPPGAVSPATTEGRSNSFGSARGKSRLPETAPFSRVWGKWRDDGHFYAGTILSVSGGRFYIVFDDDSRGKLLPDELRRCELQRGDIVRYVGGEEAETETQVVTLQADVQVIRVERNTSGEDAHGELQGDDIIVAASTTHIEGRTTRLLVNAVSIHSDHGQQFDNRKLTADEMAAFGFRERQKPPEPLSLAKPPKPIEVEQFSPSKNTTGLFHRTAFLITGLSSDKSKLVELLTVHGATIIEWEHLFEVNAATDSTSPPELFWPKVDFKAIDEIFLLADKPSTTVKYLVALALGVPCLSKEFAIDSVTQNIRIDWRPYALVAGFIQQLNTQALGSQLAAILKTSFNLDSLKKRHEEGGAFKGRTFLVVTGEKTGGGSEEPKKRKKQQTKDEREDLNRRLYQYLSLLSTASASLVHFVSSPSDASAGQGYDHVFLDGDFRIPKALAGHKGLVNITWVKQCLMAGRLLPSARMKEVDEK